MAVPIFALSVKTLTRFFEPPSPVATGEGWEISVDLGEVMLA
jgi:hypothetical protein